MEQRRSLSPLKLSREVMREGLYLGDEVATSDRVLMPLSVFDSHVHIMGPPGVGKSRLLLWLFQMLAMVRNATVIVLNPKGALCKMAADWAIKWGFADRLVILDPGNTDLRFGYNPLRPNGLSIETHAKTVREGIRSSHNQASFDETAQLARILYLSLAVTRTGEYSLVETVRIIRPGPSPLREKMIGQIKDIYLREALIWFDKLTPTRQEQLAASSLARLEAFVLDPNIRDILTAQNSLDMAQVIQGKKLVLVNLEIGKPLVIDDVKLLGRLIVNDIVAHVQQRDEPDPTDVYLLGDEIQNFATKDLCLALDMGRELKLHCVLAHHFLGQLQAEDDTGVLLGSVMACTRTKVFFGGLTVQDLRILSPETRINEFDPMKVKDEIDGLEVDPVRRYEVSPSMSVKVGTREGQREGESESEGTSESDGTSTRKGRTFHSSDGQSNGWSRRKGATRSHSDGRSKATARTQSDTETDSHGVDQGDSSTDGDSRTDGAYMPGRSASTKGESVDDDGYHVNSSSRTDYAGASAPSSRSTVSTRSQTYVARDSHGSAHQEGTSEQDGANSQDSVSNEKGWSVDGNRSHEHGLAFARDNSRNHSTSETQSQSTERGRDWSRDLSIAHSSTLTGYYGYKDGRVPVSRAFETETEFLTACLQQMKDQPDMYFMIKPSRCNAMFLRMPWVATPEIDAIQREAGYEIIRRQEFYRTSQVASYPLEFELSSPDDPVRPTPKRK